MRRLSATALMLCLLAIPAAAAPQQACFAPDTPPEGQIAACTAVITVSRADSDDYVHALFMRAQAQDRSNNTAAALADYNRVLALQPGNLPALADRGNVYLHMGDTAKSIEAFSQVIARAPTLAVGYAERGLAYDDAGDYAKAIADDDRALALGPQLAANILTNRGRANVHRLDFAHAIADEDQAIRLNAGLSDAFGDRCFARAAANRELEQALADCNASLALAPGNANAMDKRGLVYLRQNQNEKAEADFGAALAANPRLFSALYGRGLARLRQRDVGGNADLKAAAAGDPRLPVLFQGFGIR